MVINDNSESEIKSRRDKTRKKYQLSSIERNSYNYSQNNTALNLEQAPLNNYERNQTHLNSTNGTVIKDNNLNIVYNTLNSKDETNDMNPQELKIKELENKVRLLEEKSLQIHKN